MATPTQDEGQGPMKMAGVESRPVLQHRGPEDALHNGPRAGCPDCPPADCATLVVRGHFHPTTRAFHDGPPGACQDPACVAEQEVFAASMREDLRFAQPPVTVPIGDLEWERVAFDPPTGPKIPRPSVRTFEVDGVDLKPLLDDAPGPEDQCRFISPRGLSEGQRCVLRRMPAESETCSGAHVFGTPLYERKEHARISSAVMNVGLELCGKQHDLLGAFNSLASRLGVMHVDRQDFEDGFGRWEIGFRNIVTIVLGPDARVEIPTVIEQVRGAVQCTSKMLGTLGTMESMLDQAGVVLPKEPPVEALRRVLVEREAASKSEAATDLELANQVLDAGLGRRLVEILSRHCGETGESEGAVETLQRIIRQRDDAIGQAHALQLACEATSKDLADERAKKQAVVLHAEETERMLAHVTDERDALTKKDVCGTCARGESTSCFPGEAGAQIRALRDELERGKAECRGVYHDLGAERRAHAAHEAGAKALQRRAEKAEKAHEDALQLADGLTRRVDEAEAKATAFQDLAKSEALRADRAQDNVAQLEQHIDEAHQVLHEAGVSPAAGRLSVRIAWLAATVVTSAEPAAVELLAKRYGKRPLLDGLRMAEQDLTRLERQEREARERLGRANQALRDLASRADDAVKS